ncbi:hypothetical protein [Haladaptatus caseinilyticus]|uniref:hypothetical protein n=1 Tax=Haladaptatus caseinilyticus TaxID=2993314 RepID=UPI00224B25AB|nr:hypothetical protein [Haladaptatus caseinilyticus]
MATDDHKTERTTDGSNDEPEEHRWEERTEREESRAGRDGESVERRKRSPRHPSERQRPTGRYRRDTSRDNHRSRPPSRGPSDPPRNEGRRGTESYSGRYGSRVRKREAGERAREGVPSEPHPRRSENRREAEPTEVEKYGGPRDPDWERRRQLKKAEWQGNQRMMDVAFGQQRPSRQEKSTWRYQRGQR